MELREHLLSLISPLAPGKQILDGVVLFDATAELGLRYCFEVGQQPIWIDVMPIERAQSFAARSQHFAFSYRTEGGRKLLDPKLCMTLCKTVAQMVESNESTVLAALRSDIQEVPEKEAKIRRVTISSLLERMGSKEAPFYALNPYLGCLIGCRFCYAQETVGTLRSLLGLREVPWGSYVDVRINAHEILEKELDTLPPQVIKFSPIVSDPYQAIEEKELITQKCLKVLAKKGGSAWPVLLLTRSVMIMRDLDLIASIGVVRAGVSFPTSDEKARQHFENRGASVAERIEILAALKKHGIQTLAVVQPILDENMAQLADVLAPVVDSVSIDVLRGEMGAHSDFATPLYEHWRSEQWQRESAQKLAEELRARGVLVWEGELPNDLRPC